MKANIAATSRCGIPLRFPPTRSLVPPLELTAAYVPFANGGVGVIAHGILRIRTKSGKVLWQRKPSDLGAVIAAENLTAMTDLMTQVVSSGTGKAAQLEDRPVAGKTGTTQDYHDAWFVGFTADLICGVWIGNDDNAPMIHATGGTLPARIFKRFMVGAEQGFAVRPLTAAQAVASAEAPEQDAAEQSATPDAEKNKEKKPADSFQSLLDRLFGT